MTVFNTPVTVLGHPFASIGMGEQMRAGVRALRAAGCPVRAFDIYRYSPRTDPNHIALMADLETTTLDAGIRIFHMNGDEVGPALAHMEAGGHDLDAGYNIIVPAWELPVYPAVWVEALRRFNEVWAMSRFVQDALAAAGVASHYVGQSAEIDPVPFLPRRHFRIREPAFVFLTAFDTTSFVSRKNPYAVVEMFRRVRAQRPYADIQLVLKAKSADGPATGIFTHLDLTPADCVVIDRPLATHEQHSLLNAADCLVSLHRSEGFGRGLGEAMSLGRTALGTGWSGNVDFMAEDNACLVRHGLTPLRAGDYPHGEGQSWADPDIDHAVWHALRLIDDPAEARARAARGRRTLHRTMGHRAVGLRMMDRVLTIARGTP